MAVAMAGAGCPGSELKGSDDTAAPPDTAAPADTAEPLDTAEPGDAAPVDTEDVAAPPDTEFTADVALPTTLSLVCTNDADCVVACATGRCEETRCVFEAPQPGCVAIDAAASVGDCVDARALAPTSDCLFCSPGVQVEGYTSVAWFNDFESGAVGMSVEPLAETEATWTVTTRRSAGGTRSLYFGHPSEATYEVGGRAAGQAVTPPIAAPPGASLVLSFELWLETEEMVGFDFLRVLLDRGTGALPVELWRSDALGGTTHGEFLPVSLALGPASEGMRVVFEFDTIDGIINRFEGAYLDNIRVATTCCARDANCSDADRCTADRCVDGACVFEPIADCCLLAADCDDGDACTRDVCPVFGGSCASTPIFGCCLTAADCDDGDPCTRDVCPAEGAQCVNQPLCCTADAQCDDGDPCTAGRCEDTVCQYVNACCASAADCDDGDPCTTDSCVGTTCRHDFRFVVGCCRPNVLTQRFDSGPPPGWLFSSPTANVGWHIIHTPEAQSGTSVLYYGHPTLNYYDSGGANSGTVTTSAFQLPVNVDVQVTMRALLDVEANPARDLFVVEALIGAVAVPIATKADAPVGGWRTVTADVSYLAGRIIRLRFKFDTVDGVANTTRGVFVDDLRVVSSCQPRTCQSDAGCPSLVECIIGSCQAGRCSYSGC